MTEFHFQTLASGNGEPLRIEAKLVEDGGVEILVRLPDTSYSTTVRALNGCLRRGTGLCRTRLLFKPSLRSRFQGPASGVREPGDWRLTRALVHCYRPGMKRRSNGGKSARRLADDAGDLSVRPKYAPIPGFGVVVLESRHSAEWTAPGWFDEDFNKFLLLVSGSVRLRTRTRQHRIDSPGFVHFSAHAPHFIEDLPGDPVVVYVIHYRPHVLPDSLSKEFASVPIRHWNLSGSAMAIAQPIRAKFLEMLFEQSTRRVGWEVMMTSLLLRLAVRAARLGSGQEPEQAQAGIGAAQGTERVVAYLTRLESGFFQQQTLETAAQSSGLSRRQFTRIFRQLTGTTWREHLQSLRLKYACKLLVESDSPILPISFECGFESPSNFYRAFKAAFGCAPSVFRERNRPA